MRRPAALAVALMLFATACGGSAEFGEDTGQGTEAVFDAAAVNAFDLELTGDITTSQLLDVATGEIVAIEDLVDGERPILAWFWAPH